VQIISNKIINTLEKSKMALIFVYGGRINRDTNEDGDGDGECAENAMQCNAMRRRRRHLRLCHGRRRRGRNRSYAIVSIQRGMRLK
jgi:hypothetical protein